MEVLEKMGAVEAQKKQSNVPICTVNELAEVDAIVFGTLLLALGICVGKCDNFSMQQESYG